MMCNSNGCGCNSAARMKRFVTEALRDAEAAACRAAEAAAAAERAECAAKAARARACECARAAEAAKEEVECLIGHFKGRDDCREDRGCGCDD